MKRIFFLLSFIFILQSSGFSQHFPIYSQYMLNGLAINPAYAGSRDVLSASLLWRKQWVGMPGAPNIFSLGAHMPFRNERLAAGLLIYDEKIGFERSTGIFGNYAYRVRLGNGKLSLGLKGGGNLLKELDNKISLRDPTPDKAFENIKESRFLPNFGVGAYYVSSKYFIGLSIPTILTYTTSGTTSKTEYNSFNILFTTGYLWKLSDQFKLKPSTLVKYKLNSSMQFDLNMNMIFFEGDILWIGASYRNNDAIVGLFEIQVSRKFRLGYSYDYTMGPLSNSTNGSHEILIRYEWRDKVNTLNPLYF